MSHLPRRLRIASVVPSFNAGGVGTVCRYAAEGMARRDHSDVTLLSLHDPEGESLDSLSGLRLVSLGLDDHSAQRFLRWLAASPQDLVITSDVSRIEPAFPYLPGSTRHIVQIHDSMRRYREVAVRNQLWIDGVTCVGQHIEERLRTSMGTGYRGLVRTIHNGASFPPLKTRDRQDGPLRLLFMGRVEALKGAFDLVPILLELKKRDVPVQLTIVGGENITLRRQLDRAGVGKIVSWVGKIPHERCYDVAAESDIFMMTSRKEPFGMTTIEAMCMGCVPIAYDSPSGSTEIIEHGKSGLLVPLGDYKKWADTVEKLYCDPSLLDALSDRAIDRARSKFNADTMTNEWLNFIDNVMSNSESTPARRQLGNVATISNVNAHVGHSYYRLPEKFRSWIRDKVYSHPQLSHWLLSR